jgi:hypothetical protein
LIKLRRDAAAQAPIDEDVKLSGNEICLRNFGALTITVVDFYIVLLEAQLFCFTAIDTCCNAEELRNAKINEIAARCANPLKIVVVLHFGNFFDSDLNSATGKMNQAASILHHPMFRKKTTSGRLTSVQIDLL